MGVKWLVLVLTAAMVLDHLEIGGTIVAGDKMNETLLQLFVCCSGPLSVPPASLRLAGLTLVSVAPCGIADAVETVAARSAAQNALEARR